MSSSSSPGGPRALLLALAATLLLAVPGPAQTLQERLENASHVLRRLSSGVSLVDLYELSFPLNEPQAPKIQAFLDAQFDPASLSGSSDSLELQHLLETYRTPDDAGVPDPDDQYDDWVLQDLQAETLARLYFSRAQLQELMTFFWRAHFNTNYNKVRGYFVKEGLSSSEADAVATWFEWQQMEGFRLHSLGYFEDLLFVSAQGVPMTIYLDNVKNVAPGGNENYARELMELHTLGLDENGEPVHYDDGDVEIAADVFSGWGVAAGAGNQYAFDFDGNAHIAGDPGTAQKTLFDTTALPDLVLDDDFVDPTEGEDLLRYLAGRPETAAHVVRKLWALLLNEDVPGPGHLTFDAAVAAWGSRGDISAVLRILVESDDFLSDPTNRWSLARRPYETVGQTIRINLGTTDPDPGAWQSPSVDTDVKARMDSIRIHLESELDTNLFRWPSPDGRPYLGLDLVSTAKFMGQSRFASRMYTKLLQNPPYHSDVYYDPLSTMIGVGVSPIDQDAWLRFLQRSQILDGFTVDDAVLHRLFISTDSEDATGTDDSETFRSLLGSDPPDVAEWQRRVYHIMIFFAHQSAAFQK